MSQGVKSTSSSLPTLSRTRIAIVIVVWTVLTLPLVTLGPGSDVDAWTVARTGERIWASGTYIRSRTSGFPLYELALAPLTHFGGTVATNAFSLACGLICIVLWLRLAARGVMRRPLMMLCAFAFLPVFVKNAASTMDYVPALALLLGAYLAWEERHVLWCAVLVGVACGVRPTSALFIVPAAIAVFVERRRLTTALAMVAVTAVVATIAFWPSLRLGGFGPVRSITFLQGVKTGVALFGLLQTPVVAIAALVFRSAGKAHWSAFDAFHVTNIAVFSAAFAIHPGGTEYLLPIVPSVLLLLDRHLSMVGVATVCLALLSYHVIGLEVEGARGGMRPVAIKWAGGLTVRDINDRRFKLWLKDAVRTWRGTQPTVLLEQQMQPFAADARWSYDPDLNTFRTGTSMLAVAAMIDDVQTLSVLRAKGFRIVASRDREWQYERPEGAAADPLIEFVDDLGVFLGSPMQGKPLE